MALSVDIQKRLGNFELQVKFETAEGMLAILGASGCGKSMTLKCIAGIETPDRGRVVLDDVVLFDSEKHINLKPQNRKVGYQFQQYALFPNMTALQNVMCGVREGNRQEKRQKALAIIDRLHLNGCENKKPSMLSGGQQQRCALARILVNEPQVLLLDEPFSALDAHLRFHTERQVENIINDFGKTVLFVSHDRDEVFRLTDKIAVMENGHLKTMGEKHEVFKDPSTIGGAILTGCKNISDAEILSPNRVFAKDWGIELSVGEIPEDFRGVGIRMHDVKLLRHNGDHQASAENAFHCKVIGEIENPFSCSIMLRPDGKEGERYILVDLNKERWNEIRSEYLDVCLPSEKILLLK
ncbi:MAG: ATP-binding cassette domain-containing protein [Lachnospiraceae bacterium]|nr:ATP-binding cassette domain-containing protein [Lachnospiraceae bacterium]